MIIVPQKSFGQGADLSTNKHRTNDSYELDSSAP